MVTVSKEVLEEWALLQVKLFSNVPGDYGLYSFKPQL